MTGGKGRGSDVGGNEGYRGEGIPSERHVLIVVVKGPPEPLRPLAGADGRGKGVQERLRREGCVVGGV